MAEALQGLRLDACDARARSQRRQSREVRHIRLAQRLGMAPGHPGDDAQMARRLPLRRAKGRPTAERAVPAGRARRLGRGRADIFEEALLGDTEVVDKRRNHDCGQSAVTEDHMHALRRGALFPLRMSAYTTTW